MPKTAKDLVQAASADVPTITPQEAMALLESGDAVALDVREPGEVAQGKIAGAIAVPRGLLEFQADPGSNRPEGLAEDKTVLVYCAAGGRAALAGQTLKAMGYEDVCNLGGFKDWVEAGGQTE